MRRALIVILLSLVAGTAGAQTPVDSADTYFRQGNALYKEQRWADARAAFESAWKLKKSHDIAANLAYTEMKLGRFRDAAEHLSFAVRNWPPTGKADKRVYAVDGLQLAKQEVAALTIQVDAPGADVFVDGALVGQSPLADEVFAEPGSHTVEAKRAGYMAAKQAVQAQKGGAQAVALSLALEPPPVPMTAGTLPTPPAPPAPAVERRPLWPVIVAGGAAVVAVGVGTGLTLAANGKGSDLAQLQDGHGSTCFAPGSATAMHCTDLHAAASSKVTLSNAAASTFLVGGALAGAAAGLAIWATRSPAVTVRATAAVGPGQAAVTLRGAW